MSKSALSYSTTTSVSSQRTLSDRQHCEIPRNSSPYNYAKGFKPLCKKGRQPRVKMRESDAKYLLNAQFKKLFNSNLDLNCIYYYFFTVDDLVDIIVIVIIIFNII